MKLFTLIPTCKIRTFQLYLLLVALSCTYKVTQAQTTFAISNGDLYMFDAATPGASALVGTVTGITPGQMLEGIDFRPLTGQMYGLGYDRLLQQAQLYIIDPGTAVATPVTAGAVSLVLGPVGITNLDVTFDFNPTVDRIRVMSNRDYNYRLHPVTGAVVFTDLTLQYAGADLNAGQNPNIATGAYTNSYVGSTSTTLYDIDTKLRILAKQDPPNNGTLNTIGTLNGGILKSMSAADLDIYYNAMTQMNEAYLSVNSNAGVDKLVSIDLTSGMGTVIGVIGTGMYVDDIACMIDRSYPALTGNLGYALNTNNFLLAFDDATPQIIREAVPVTGITLNQSLVGLDFRPATGDLYALGYNSATGESQLYTINTLTGAATAVNTTPTMLTLGGTQVGFDFNPTVDKIRVVSANNMNYRLNTDGTLAFTDLNLNFGGADINFGTDPAIGAAGYTNSFAGAVTTSLYVHDNLLNVIALQSPPNDGVLTTVGSTGVAQNTTDATTDLDITYDGVMNWGYFSANAGTSNFDKLYSLDLVTGMAMDMGWIGNGIAVKNIAFPIYDPMRSAQAASQIDPLQVILYPNPVQSYFRLQLENTESSEITTQIFDLSGSMVYAASGIAASGSGIIEISVEALAQGTYFVRIFSGEQTTTVPFVKQ